MRTKIQAMLLALIMGTSVNVMAQKTKTSTQQPKQETEKKEATPEERAKKMTDKMTTNLSLTSDQQTKIYNINLKYAKQRSDAKAKQKDESKMTDAERTQMKEAMKKSMDAQEAEFKTVLTSEQYQKYIKMKEEKKEEVKKEKATEKEQPKK